VGSVSKARRLPFSARWAHGCVPCKYHAANPNGKGRAWPGFLAALEARGRFAGHSSERTWLTSILKHRVVDHFRRCGRERPEPEIRTKTMQQTPSLAAVLQKLAMRQKLVAANGCIEQLVRARELMPLNRLTSCV
jgi:hypothetical protein